MPTTSYVFDFAVLAQQGLTQSATFSLAWAPFAVAIIAILTGCGMSLAGSIMRHRERMAMIEQGMHPDDPAARAAFKAAKKGTSPNAWTDYQPPKV